MFTEMEQNFKVEYVAGGATQNALRVAQVSSIFYLFLH